MNYIVSGEELKELIIHHSIYQDNIVNDFIATKRPVELVGEGLLTDDSEYVYISSNKPMQNLDDLLTDKYNNKNIKIYIEEVK